MAELGKAYIEVRADLAKFPAELRTKLIAALKAAIKDVDFKELGDAAEKAGGDAGERAGKGFAKKGKAALDKAAKEAGKSALSRLTGFFDSRRGNDSGSLFGSISGAISGGIADGLKAGQSAASSIGDFGSKIGGAFSKVGDIGGSVGSVLQIGAMALLIPVAIQLAGALVQLGGALFALPALAGVAVAAIAPLIIAFQGIGGAVSAGLSGDTEAFNQALKGLAPSARSVVKEIVGLGPAFKSIKANVQGAFFAPLVGTIKPLAQTLLPVLNNGLTIAAKSLGRFAAGFVDLLTSNDIVEDIGDVFESTSRIIDRIAPSLVNLGGVLFGVMEKGLPFVERFFAAIGTGIDRFTSFLGGIQQDGRLNSWLEKASAILGDTVRLAKELGTYLLTILGGEIGDNGASFINDFADAVARLNAYLKSEDGQKALHNIGVLTKAAGAAFLFFVESESSMLAALNFAFDAVRTFGSALEAIGGAAVTAGAAIGDFAVFIGTTVADAFTTAYHAVLDFFTYIGTGIHDFFTETIPAAFSATVEWFEALPGKIGDALQSGANSTKGFFLDLLKGWYADVLEGIGILVGFFLATPYLIKTALTSAGSFIADTFKEGFANALEAATAGIDWIVDAVLSIPGRLDAAGEAIWGFFVSLGTGIRDFLLTIPGLLGDAGSAIAGFFTDLWNGVVTDSYNAVVGGFTSVIAWIEAIPGRITALGPKILDAARGIGRNIANGLSEIGNFASDLGKKVLNALKSGINFVIDSINRGIADVDDALPVSLPRIPKLAKGAIVDRPTLAMVGEAGTEVVLPLNDPARARQLADESGLFNLLQTGKPSSGPTINVYLDPSGVLIPITRTVVDEALDQQGNELAFAREA